MLLLKRSPLANCWVCNECETENSLSAHYCEVCGRPYEEPPVYAAARESSPFYAPDSISAPPSEPLPQAESFYPQPAAPAAASAPEKPNAFVAFLRRYWYAAAALLLLLGAGIGLLIHFSGYEERIDLNDGSYFLYSKSFGSVNDLDFYSAGESEPADTLVHNSDFTTVEYAVYNDRSGRPSNIIYFSELDDSITYVEGVTEPASSRLIEYDADGNLSKCTLYNSDGTLNRVIEYYSFNEVGAAPAGSISEYINNNNFDVFPCRRQKDYGEGNIMHTEHEYDTDGRKLWQISYDTGAPSGEVITEMMEFAYNEDGKTTYRCNADRQRLTATEPDGTYWTYHYNSNNEFVNRTRLVESIDWDYSERAVDLSGFTVYYSELSETVTNCSQFKYSYRVKSVSEGKVEGKFKIYIRTDKNKWVYVDSFNYTKQDGEYPKHTGCVELDKPMNFNAIAFMPSTQRSLSWVSSAGFSNFVIQDRNY